MNKATLKGKEEELVEVMKMRDLLVILSILHFLLFHNRFVIFSIFLSTPVCFLTV